MQRASSRRPLRPHRNLRKARVQEWERRRGHGSSWQYEENSRKYNKAMNRLARQEREARAKAARHYEDDRRDPRYRERLAEIDRRYDHKRYQVRRNLRND